MSSETSAEPLQMNIETMTVLQRRLQTQEEPGFQGISEKRLVLLVYMKVILVKRKGGVSLIQTRSFKAAQKKKKARN